MPIVLPSGDDRSRQIPTNASQVRGSANLSHYADLYKQIVQRNGGQAPYAMPNPQQNFKQQQEEPAWKQQHGYREMNDFEKTISGIGRLGETIAGASGGFQGFNENESPVESLAKFAFTLPTGMASAPFTGTAHLMEGVTGTPFTETEGDYIADYELDTGQRVGALGTGLVDTAGLLLGGSAQALNAGRNVLRAGLGKSAVGPVGLTASRFMGRGPAAVAVDTAEEGLEEGLQSFAEDLRYDQLNEDSFGRAAEAAGWGALGGAMMSGGGQMLNSALHNGDSATARTNAPTHVQTQNEFGRNLGITRDPNGLSQSVQKYLQEQQTKTRAVKGSSIQLLVSSRSTDDVTKAGVGLDWFDGQWRADKVSGAQEALAKGLQTDRNTLATIMNDPDPKKRIQGINNLIAASNGNAYVVMARTPASSMNQDVAVKLDLVECFAGNGLSVHRAIQKLIGADQDGDTVMGYVGGDAAPKARYVFRQMYNEANGSSLLDGEYLSFMHNAGKTKELLTANDAVENLLGIDPSDPGYTNAKELLEKLANEIEARAASGDFDTSQFANYMSRLQRAIWKYDSSQKRSVALADANNLDQNGNLKKEIESSIKEEAGNVADRRLGNLVMQLESSAKEGIETQVKKVVSDGIRSANEQTQGLLRDVAIHEGKIGSGASADIEVELGKVLTALLTGGHPVFRQEGAWYYATHEIKGLLARKDIKSALNSPNVFAEFVAYAYKLQDVGLDVENAINGYYTAMIAANVLSDDYGKTDVDDEKECKSFINSFVKRTNEAVDDFNKAISATDEIALSIDPSAQETLKYYKGMAQKRKISEDDVQGFAKEFFNVFGDTKFNELFHMGKDDAILGEMTPRQYARYVGSGYEDNPFFFDSELKKYMHALVTVKNTNDKSVAIALSNNIDAIRRNIYKLREYNVFNFIGEDDINKIPDEVYQVASTVMNLIHETVGPEVALALGIADIVGFYNSTWGKAIASGDEKKFRGALRSLIFIGKLQSAAPLAAQDKANAELYNDILDAFSAITDYQNQANGMTEQILRTHLQKALEMRMNDSDLFAFLYQRLEAFGVDGVMDFILKWSNIDTNEEELLDQLRTFSSDPSLEISDMWLNLFSKGDEDLELSSVSKRIKKAKIESVQAINQSGEYMKQQMKAIRDKIDAGEYKIDDVVAAFEDGAHEGSVRLSRDLLATVIHSSKGILKEDTDKGRSRTSASLAQQAVSDAIVGTVFSTIDAAAYSLDLMSVGNFVLNRSQVLALIFDKNATINLWDYVTDENGVSVQTGGKVTYYDIYASAGINIAQDESASPEQVLELFEKYPQLMSLSVPQTVSPIYSETAGDSIQAGMSQPPVAYIASHIKKGANNRLVSRIRNRIEIEILSDVDAYARLVASVEDIEHKSLSQVRDIVDSVINQHIDYFYNGITATDVEFRNHLKHGYPDALVTSIANTIDEMVGSVTELSSLRTASVAFHGQRQKAVAHLQKYLIQRKLGDLAKKYSIDLPDIDTDYSYKIDDSLYTDYVNLYAILFATEESNLHEWISSGFEEVFGSSIEEYFDALLTAINPPTSVQHAIDPNITNFLNEVGYDPANPKDLSGFIKMFIDPTSFTGLTPDTTNIHYLTETDVHELTADELVKKCEQILIVHGGNTGFDENGGLKSADRNKIKEAVDKRDKNKSDAEDALKEILWSYNQIAMSAITLGITAPAGRRVNESAPIMTARMLGTQKEMLIGLREQFKDEYGDSIQTSELSGNWNMPKFFLGDPAVALASTRAREMMLSSPIQAGIAMDASNVNYVGAFGLLDNGSPCGAMPERLNESQARALVTYFNDFDSMKRANPARYDELKVILPGFEEEDLSEYTFVDENGRTNPFDWANFVKARDAGMTEFLIYRNVNCRHGSCKNHAGGKTHNLIGNTISYLVSESMEAGWLKRKKVFGALASMVRMVEDNKIDLKKGVNDFSDLNKILINVRHDIASVLKNQLTQDEYLPSLGFTQRNWIALASAVSPYMRVRVTTASGETKEIVVSVNDLFDEDAFRQKYGLEPGDVIVTAEVGVCGLDEVANKILMGIRDAMRNKTSFKKSELESAVANSYNDWSGYGMPMDVEGIMRRVPYRSAAARTSVYGDLSWTAAQAFEGRLISDIREQYQERYGIIQKEWKRNIVDQIDLANGRNDVTLRSTKDSSNSSSNFVGSITVIGRSDEIQKIANQFPKASSLGSGLIHASESSNLQMRGIEEVYISVDEYPSNEDIAKAFKAMNNARNMGHSFTVDENMFKAMKSWINKSLEDNFKYSSAFADAESNNELTINAFKGRKFYQIDVAMINGQNRYVGTDWAINLGYAENNNYGLLVSDKYLTALADGGTKLHSKYLSRFQHTQDAVSTYLVRDFFANRFDIGAQQVATIEEIKNAFIDGNTIREDLFSDKSRVDTSFYKKSNAYNNDYMVAAMKNYLEKVANGSVTMDGFVSGAMQGDVIGFVRQGNVFVPIFYAAASSPNTADVSFDINRTGKLVMRASGDFNTAEGFNKISPYGISFKSILTLATAEDEDNWLGVEDPFGRYDKNNPPEIMIDGNSLNSREYGLESSALCESLYRYSVAVGFNVFFKYDRSNSYSGADGNGSFFKVRKSDLLRDDLSDEDLTNLLNGHWRTWDRVASGELQVFKDSKQDRLFRDFVSAVQINSGGTGDAFKGLFCTRGVKKDANGDWVDTGRFDRDGEYPKLILSKFNDDQILKLYHMMDPMLCPDGTVGALEDTDGDWMFDRFGRVKTPQGRRRCIFTKITEMAIGGSFMSTSGGASWAGQAEVQRLLRLGYFAGDTKEILSYLLVRNGTLPFTGDGIIKKADKRGTMSDKEFEASKSRVNKSMHDRVRANTGTAQWIISARRHREECIAEINSFNHPVRIFKDSSKHSELATKDDYDRNGINALCEDLNNALQMKDNKRLSFAEITQLCRFAYAYSDSKQATGDGFKGLTVSQFKKCLDLMKRSIDETGLIVSSQIVKGAHTDIRVTIPMLPKNLAEKLYGNSDMLNGRWETFDDFTAAMKEETLESLKLINRVDNQAKKHAIQRMIDGAAITYGWPLMSGYCTRGIYLDEVVDSIKKWGASGGSGWSQEVFDEYERLTKMTIERLADLDSLAFSRNHDEVDYDKAYGGTLVTKFPTDQDVGSAILRTLAEARKTIGLTYLELLPANILERKLNQGYTSLALKAGRAGWGPYQTTRTIDDRLRKHFSRDERVIKLWSAMREAQMINAEDELLYNLRNEQDYNIAIEKTFKDRGKLAEFNAKFVNVMSGKDIAIRGQLQNFLDRFVMQIDEKAPWWAGEIESTDVDGNVQTMTLLESAIAADPAAWLIQIFNGDGQHVPVDRSLALNALNWALRGDMAQKNLVSAIYSELAKRSAGLDFFMSCFMTPYFNYATNRAGRLLQWVAPVSSVHHVLVKFFSEGGGRDWKIPGTDITLGDMHLEDVQLTRDMREACMLDIMHLGPAVLAMMLIGAGALQPPEDEDKWGNFKEWTFFGTRIDANWWVEDTLGLALPMAAFGASIREGKPRVDLIVNGLTYYLGNNPAVKVSDAVGILFDPLGEFQKDYDNDVEGYAKAMGGPPSPAEVAMGKFTSFGLSFFAQFVTPGIYRELYNTGLDQERDYKKVYQEGVYGEQTAAGEQGEKVQYTSYQDAIVRKFTRNNPIMGGLADLIFHPETGYMAHEMPKQVVYDPFQMNAISHFSLYNDPYTKTDPKTDEEKSAIAIEVIGTLQSKSVEELSKEGFVLDYETKEYVSAYIWDIIASLNAEHDAFEESEYANYYYWGDYETGRETVTAIRNDYKKITQEWKDLYYDKLWSKEFTVARYHRNRTTWEQDDNGEFYATGYYPEVGAPILLPPGESPGAYKENMGAKYDWQTESTVTGMPTGMRGLVPFDDSAIDTPAITSWSKDGTDTGLSGINNGASTNELSPVLSDILTDAKTTSSNGGRSYGRSSGGGGGYYRRGGGYGGGGGGGYAPSIYSRVNAPNISNADTMRSSRNYEPRYDSLRPSFETKGSRESYRREDI